MFKLLSLGNIFFWIEKLTKFINSIFFVLLLVALSFALILSPPDYLQGDSVRICLTIDGLILNIDQLSVFFSPFQDLRYTILGHLLLTS